MDSIVIEKNRLLIRSNPYLMQTSYYWLEENGKWKNVEDMENESFPLFYDRFICLPISHIAYDLLKTIKEEIYNPRSGLLLEFEGTEDDYNTLVKTKETYFSDLDIEVEFGGFRVQSAKEVMPCIEQSYKTLEEYFAAYPDPDTKAIIDRYQEAVKPEIALCVMGLYSSGKSAFINSLVGKELLPSDSDPATAKIYKIYNSPESYIRFEFMGENYRFDFQGDKWKSNNTPNSEIMNVIKEAINENVVLGDEKNDEDVNKNHENDYMYWTLYGINDFARKEAKERHDELICCAKECLPVEDVKESKNDEDLIGKLLSKKRLTDLVNEKKISDNKLNDVIEVHTSFVQSYLPLDKYDFVIYDTPGSNSVMFREHSDILKNSLEQQTNGLPIFVTTPDTMDETDNESILFIINEMGGALDASNTMLVVNKSDDKSSKTLRKKSENKDESVVMKWRPSRVYFVSSVVCLGGKKTASGEKRWIDHDYRKIYNKNKDIFDDPNDDEYLRLFSFNILPEDAREELFDRVERISDDELLLWNSGIPCVEEDIGFFADKHALYNKCRQAILYLTDAAKRVEEDVGESIDKAKKTRNRIKEKYNDATKELMNSLGEICRLKLEQFTTEFANSVTRKAVEELLDGERIKKIIEEAKNSSEGKNTYEKLDPFDKKIESHLRTDVEFYSKMTSRKIDEYWLSKSQELRDELMSTVVGSSALDAEQKALLEDVLMESVVVPKRHVNLNIQNTSAIKNKGERFLWFLWDITRIDELECRKEYKKALETDIGNNNSEVIKDNEASFNEWTENLMNRISVVAARYNPNLAELTKELTDETQRIVKKNNQKEIIQLQIDAIKKLVDFEEVDK